MTEFSDKIVESVRALRHEPYTTWLGSYSPYQCEKCGFYVDSKTRYCPECGRRANNYEV